MSTSYNNRSQSFIGSLWNWLLASSHPNPESATREFITDFDYEYSPDHPRFIGGSYQTAVADAHTRSKLLMVYLHSPLHEDTDRFCNGVLCSSEFTEYVDNNFLLWGGSTYDVEGYSLSLQLNVTSFPFIGIFQCTGNRSVKLLDRFQGYTTGENITNKLQHMLIIHNAMIAQTQEQDFQRQEEISLRMKQDREYEEAMELDRQAIKQQEDEERERQRIELETQQKQELEEALQLSKELDYQAMITRKKDKLPVEPTGPSSDIATIRFQLPQNAKSVKMARKFLKTDTVQVKLIQILNIYNYAISLYHTILYIILYTILYTIYYIHLYRQCMIIY